jgi:hypothetical protein
MNVIIVALPINGSALRMIKPPRGFAWQSEPTASPTVRSLGVYGRHSTHEVSTLTGRDQFMSHDAPSVMALRLVFEPPHPKSSAESRRILDTKILCIYCVTCAWSYDYDDICLHRTILDPLLEPKTFNFHDQLSWI